MWVTDPIDNGDTCINDVTRPEWHRRTPSCGGIASANRRKSMAAVAPSPSNPIHCSSTALCTNMNSFHFLPKLLVIKRPSYFRKAVTNVCSVSSRQAIRGMWDFKLSRRRVWSSESSALMIETARTSETSVDIQLRTWQYIPEDSELNSGNAWYRSVQNTLFPPPVSKQRLLVTGYSYGVASYKASQALRPCFICCASPSPLIHPPLLSGCTRDI
jgi:hypothetical protein